MYRGNYIGREPPLPFFSSVINIVYFPLPPYLCGKQSRKSLNMTPWGRYDSEKGIYWLTSVYTNKAYPSEYPGIEYWWKYGTPFAVYMDSTPFMANKSLYVLHTERRKTKREKKVRQLLPAFQLQCQCQATHRKTEKERQLADGRQGKGVGEEPNHSTTRKHDMILYILFILSCRI